ncbi:conserved hypothetical protein [Chloroherpeton thalassium ATCC 35110]|uniref:DUF4139 domain-containing protein n=1 Tax=Chloroherpeton thalassium (strain ATCC 35110 / GB-78) TaxID=517418 RepID=B3QUI5_CHLT3|nr:DUF4139 domain-containing protein [Chloroherpeton thalassium]ACF12891.1 conserved hypothetical protein [Chloroherpeton thalassium ATCC 35110]
MLKITQLFLLGTLLIQTELGALQAQDLERKSLAVTVYNANFGIVKDVREAQMKSGISEIRLTDVAAQIDPTSVLVKSQGSIIEQNFRYDLASLSKILERYIEKEIRLIGEDKELLEGTLLSVQGNSVVLRKKDGGLLLIPSIDDYRLSVEALPDGLITKPTLVWLVNSKKSGKENLEVSYKTYGIRWHAEYVALLNPNDEQMELKAWVSVENNSGASYPNAKLKLVAGDVNQVSTQPVLAKAERATFGAAVADEAQFQENSFFEYHIYTLERPATLMENEVKQISLFEADGVRVKKKYLYRGGNSKVSVAIEFQNDKSSGLGQPMPKGTVRVMKSDGQSLEFIGEDELDHTPLKEKVNLKIGDAFDVVAEEVRENYKRISQSVNEQTYKVTLKNRKKENISVEVERYLGLNWEILDSSLKYEKKDASRVVFDVPVKSDSETVLKFTVRYVN